MPPEQLDLPSDPDHLRALVAQMKVRLAASEQALEAEREAHRATHDELAAAKNAIKLTTLQIEKLKVALARLRRMKFGQSSERMVAEQANQSATLAGGFAAMTHLVADGSTGLQSFASQNPRSGRGVSIKFRPLDISACVHLDILIRILDLCPGMRQRSG